MSQLTTNFTVTFSSNTFTITWASTYDPISFDVSVYTISASSVADLVEFGATGALTTLNYTYCTSPVRASRSLWITAINAMASSPTFSDITAETFKAIHASNQYAFQPSNTGNILYLNATTPATSDRVVTFPDPGAADSVVYLALVQSLSNKTLLDSCTVANTTTPTKKIAFDLTGATASRTLTLLSNHSANSSLYFPVLSGGSDQFAVLDLAQTFTNKTLYDTTNVFANTSTPTKQAKFDLSGATATKTLTLASVITLDRTITFPNESVTLASLTGTETFTNKTITAPSMSTILVGVSTLTLPGITDTIATRTNTETLSNKTLLTPIIASTDSSQATTLASTTDSSSSTTGGTIISGGLGVAKKLYVGTGIYLPTASGTPAELNYYDTQDGATCALGGALSGNVTLVFRRIGKLVMCNIPTFTGTASSGTTITITISALYTPVANHEEYARHNNNGANVQGITTVSGTTITLYASTSFGNFTNAVTVGSFAKWYSWGF